MNNDSVTSGALVTLSNGADNVGVYVPFFLVSQAYLALILITYAVLIAVWCFIADGSVTIPWFCVRWTAGAIGPFPSCSSASASTSLVREDSYAAEFYRSCKIDSTPRAIKSPPSLATYRLSLRLAVQTAIDSSKLSLRLAFHVLFPLRPLPGGRRSAAARTGVSRRAGCAPILPQPRLARTALFAHALPPSLGLRSFPFSVSFCFVPLPLR